MSRVFSFSFSAVAVTAAQDLFYFQTAANTVARVLSVRVGQTSDAGDAEAEQLRITVGTNTAAGSGGAAATVRTHAPNTTAFAGTARTNDTTRGAGEIVIVRDVFNVQAGWLYQPIPEEMIWIAGSGRCVVGLPVAPADSLTMTGTITFEVFG